MAEIRGQPTYGSAQPMHNLGLGELVLRGLERDYLLLDANYVYDDGRPSPIRDSDKTRTINNEWTEYYTSASIGHTFKTVATALSNLPIGNPKFESNPQLHDIYNDVHYVDGEVHPYGPNIRILFKQDKCYGYRGKFRPTDAAYESIYNVVHGVIVVTEIVTPDADGQHTRPLQRSDWSELTWHVWARLHNDQSAPTLTANMDIQPPTDLDKGAMARWSTGFKPELSVNLIPQLKDFLNYVVVQGNRSKETIDLVVRCLASRGHSEDYIPGWGHHETFQIGHWSFYALLGTDTGERIINLLSRHKQDKELGHKMLKSVTIFHAITPIEGFTAEEYDKYIRWPALIFEVVDYDQTLYHAGEATRVLWDKETEYTYSRISHTPG